MNKQEKQKLINMFVSITKLKYRPDLKCKGVAYFQNRVKNTTYFTYREMQDICFYHRFRYYPKYGNGDNL